MRTIIELPEPDRRELDELCRREGISRAEAVRRAVAGYLRQHRAPPDEALFGLWRGRDREGLAYEDAIRAEWESR